MRRYVPAIVNGGSVLTGPESDGSAGQALVTNGSGSLSFASKADLVGGVIPTSQIPAVAITEFLGSVDSEAEMLELTGQRGDYCYRTDLESAFWAITDDLTSADNWIRVAIPTVSVQSVNGQTGVVVLAAADVGAAAASHTHSISDVTSLQAALDGKASLSGAAFTGAISGTTISTSGNVGIGYLNTSTSPLYVVGTGTPGFTVNGAVIGQFQRNGTAGSSCYVSLVAGNTGSAAILLGDAAAPTIGRVSYNNSTDAMEFWVNSSIRAQITSTGALEVGGDTLRVATSKTPASASATGTAGDLCWDSSYLYVCTATNTWKRTALASW